MSLSFFFTTKKFSKQFCFARCLVLSICQLNAFVYFVVRLMRRVNTHNTKRCRQQSIKQSAIFLSVLSVATLQECVWVVVFLHEEAEKKELDESNRCNNRNDCKMYLYEVIWFHFRSLNRYLCNKSNIAWMWSFVFCASSAIYSNRGRWTQRHDSLRWFPTEFESSFGKKKKNKKR